MIPENYYRVLGLDNFASADDIKIAYRNLAKKYHPDTPNGSEEQFKRISEAYQKLQDPVSKEIIDNWIRRPKPTSPPRYGKTKPQYSKRNKYYTSEKTTYSRKVKMYGGIFTLVFLIIAISIPLFLSYRASNYHYQEGLRLTQEHQYYEATVSFNNAITWLGQKSGDASISAVRVSLDKLKSLQQAKFFINKGYDYSSNKTILAELHFLMGRVNKLESNYEAALTEWQLARKLNYLSDSISMQIGFLNAFQLEEYEAGLIEFENILSNNSQAYDALFGKAWCLQRLNRPLLSVKVYDELLENKPDQALAYFYRGHNNIVLGDTIKACSDFHNSYQLGYTPAEVYLSLQCARLTN